MFLETPGIFYQIEISRSKVILATVATVLDSKGMIALTRNCLCLLQDTFKFEDGQICRLRDDRTNMMPTKASCPL